MIPSELATLADALLAEGLASDFDDAVTKAVKVSGRLERAGYVVASKGDAQ